MHTRAHLSLLSVPNGERKKRERERESEKNKLFRSAFVVDVSIRASIDKLCWRVLFLFGFSFRSTLFFPFSV